MSKIRTVQTEVFTFEELDDDAKDRAREDQRGFAMCFEWWDCVYEDFYTIADLLGIDLSTRRSGKDKQVYFSGFCSQGDGASFFGEYAYKKGSAKAIREHAPQDTELHGIADDLAAIQRRAFYGLCATIGQGYYSNYYDHSGVMDVIIESYDRYDAPWLPEFYDEALDAVQSALRELADWLYNRLEAEHDWLLSDEVIDENMIDLEYEFTAGGVIF